MARHDAPECNALTNDEDCPEDCDCVCHLNDFRLDVLIQDALKMPRR